MNTTPCGARTRAGAPCKRQPVRCVDGRVRNGRCLNHGGMSCVRGGDPFAPSRSTRRRDRQASRLLSFAELAALIAAFPSLG